MNDYKGIRLEFENVRRKLQNDERVTREDLENVRRHAEMNPNVNSIALYAIAKRSLEDESKDEE